MKVTFLFFSSIREAAGMKHFELNLDGNEETLINVLIKLTNTLSEQFRSIIFNDNFEIKDSIKIAVNETYIPKYEFSKFKVKNGDVIAIFPPASGG